MDVERISDQFYRVYVSNDVLCESTLLEGLRVFQYLVLNGHQVVERPRDADYVLLNTCAYAGWRRSAIVERMNWILKESPEARFIIMGCLREIAPELMKSYRTTLALGHSDLEQLDSLFFRFIPFNRTPPYQWSSEMKRVLVCIGRGCVFNCSYCSIKKSIGHIQSRRIEAIVRDLESNLAAGRSCFLLGGDDLGSYGRDIQLTLPDLLAAIDAIEGDFSVLLGNIHPAWFLRYFEAVGSFLESRRSCKWLYLPIQTADKRVLKSMRRDYSIGEVSRRLGELVGSIPEIRFLFDIIVGYPTETDGAFQETLDFIARYPPSSMSICQFSPEKGTEAAELAPLDNGVIQERARRLQAAQRAAISRENRVPMAMWGAV